MKYRIVYSESDEHCYIIPVNRLAEWNRWYREDEPQGEKTPDWAVIVHQSAKADGINNALAYLSFDNYVQVES